MKRLLESNLRLDAVLGRPGAVLGRLANGLGHLGGVLKRLKLVLVPVLDWSWNVMVAFWGHLGPS